MAKHYVDEANKHLIKERNALKKLIDLQTDKLKMLTSRLIELNNIIDKIENLDSVRVNHPKLRLSKKKVDWIHRVLEILTANKGKHYRMEELFVMIVPQLEDKSQETSMRVSLSQTLSRLNKSGEIERVKAVGYTGFSYYLPNN